MPSETHDSVICHKVLLSYVRLLSAAVMTLRF